ncbi:asparagine synthase C-terminal domain-containing protein [Butyrivibrio hungatei]|nr:asparagine synthase C-terminal domain-containing protein [Butyrivibrio hungatei]
MANEDWRKQRMLLDMTTYLPDENLTKVDRESMRFSLEARCPLLDYRIVDFSMKIPFQYKYNNGVKKYILKDILYDYVPKEMMERSKIGFSIPIYKWLRTTLNSELKQYFEKDFVENQGLFKYDSLIKFLSDFTRKEQISSTQIMWSYFVFQRWYKQYLV